MGPGGSHIPHPPRAQPRPGDLREVAAPSAGDRGPGEHDARVGPGRGDAPLERDALPRRHARVDGRGEAGAPRRPLELLRRRAGSRGPRRVPADTWCRGLLGSRRQRSGARPRDGWSVPANGATRAPPGSAAGEERDRLAAWGTAGAIPVAEPGAAGLTGPVQGGGPRARREGQRVPRVVPPPQLPPVDDADPEPEGPDRHGLDRGVALPSRRGPARVDPPSPRRVRTSGAGRVAAERAPQRFRLISAAADSVVWLRSRSGSSWPPVISSTAQLVRSRMEMIPTSVPLSRTGRWRIRSLAMCSAASAMSVPGSTVSRLVLMRSATLAACGSRPSATRFTRSRSVTIPASRSPSITTTEEISLSFSSLATSANVWSGVVVFTALFITSPTCIGHLRRGTVGKPHLRGYRNGAADVKSARFAAQWSERPVKLNESTFRAGTREAEKKNSLANSVSLPTIDAVRRASRMDWVNRKFFTGRVTSPDSMRNVPSRVIPVMVDSKGCTTFE